MRHLGPLDAAAPRAYNAAHAAPDDHRTNYIPGALTNEPPGKGA
ncbi:MAG: hypothetical protein AAFP87_11820 [Pseudomonadota bacterium]